MTTRILSYWKLPAAAGVFVVLLWAAVAESSKTAPQTSAQLRELYFNHKLHVDTGLECAKCHAADKSLSSTDDLLPGHAQCGECHDVTTDCKTCHVNASPKLSPRITAKSPVFSHERHLTKGKLACAKCHADPDAPLLAGTAAHLPKMQDCMTCHSREHVKNECQTCHLPSDDLIPADHKLDWTSRHGIAAHSEEVCNLCHHADYCLKCHNGDAVFNPHPRSYISRHGQEAHLSDVSCSVCHDQREFCNSCHRQMNVLPVGHFQPNWATSEGGRHAEQAQFDLESCMACHETPGRQPVCARCHKE